MKREEIIFKLKQIVIDSLQLNRRPDELTQENLITDLGLNSVDALEILVWIENTFEIEIPDEELNASLLQSFDYLADYILKKCS